MPTQEQLIAHGYEARADHMILSNHLAGWSDGEQWRGAFVIVPKSLPKIKKVVHHRNGFCIVLDDLDKTTYYQEDLPFGHGESLDAAWKMATENIVLRMSIFEKDDPKAREQFNNRYSIYVADPYLYLEPPVDLIKKLANDLGAINASIVRTGNEHRPDATYLTADRFTKIQDQLDAAFANQEFHIEDRINECETVYLIEVKDELFYLAYPTHFWVEEDIEKNNTEDFWGEISFTKVQDITNIDERVEAAEQLVNYHQRELENSIDYERLENSKKLLLKLRRLQDEEYEKKRLEPLIEKLKTKGFELRTGHLTSSTRKDEWQSENGERYIFVVVHKDTPKIREIVECSFEAIPLIGDPSSGKVLEPETILGSGETEHLAWKSAVMGDYTDNLLSEESR